MHINLDTHTFASMYSVHSFPQTHKLTLIYNILTYTHTLTHAHTHTRAHTHLVVPLQARVRCSAWLERKV